MTRLEKKSITVAAAVILLLLPLTIIIPYGQQQWHHLGFTAEAGEGGPCIDYDQSENTISINCNASFLDVVQTINDPDVIDNLGGGEYLLNANLEVADGVTFEMSSNSDGLQYLKITGENGIIVYGKILINGVKITSWDVSEEDVVSQDMNGTIPRAYVQFAASEGSQIINSEFGYLGDVEPGRRGFDLFGGGGPSHDLEIRGSKFHDMWMAFYSNGAYNIVVDGNEYYNNIVEGATEQGILLFNPDIPDDGSTEGNTVYNNVISSSENGIRSTRSHNNVVENTTFSDIELSEYRLLGDSSLTIRGQHFDNALISEDDSETGNVVEIVDSGIIEVTEGEADEEDEDDDGDDA